MILNTIIKIARDVNYTVEKATREYDIRDDNKTRIPDAMIISYPYNVRMFIDVSVTHPCAMRYHISSSSTSLSAADTRFRLKHNKYDGIAAREGGQFIALVCETYGAMTHEFSSFLQQIITSASQTQHITPQQQQHMLTHAFTAVAFALLRGNAGMARKLVTPQPPRDIPPHQHTHHTHTT